MKSVLSLTWCMAISLLIACNNNKTNDTTIETVEEVIDTASKPPADTAIKDRPEPPPPAIDEKTPAAKPAPALNGTWVLDLVSGRKISFEALYPGTKPTMTFNVGAKTISGNTSCNSFSGNLKTDSNRINFIEPFVMTKKACPGEGEKVFLETLKNVNKYEITDDNTLTFIMGDVSIMRFRRK